MYSRCKGVVNLVYKRLTQKVNTIFDEEVQAALTLVAFVVVVFVGVAALVGLLIWLVIGLTNLAKG